MDLDARIAHILTTFGETTVAEIANEIPISTHHVRRVLETMPLDTLFIAHLLCEACEMRPWTQQAVFHDARICASCAEEEPDEGYDLNEYYEPSDI